MGLGKRLKEARDRKGITQTYAAKMLGITNTALSNYERGFRDPDTDLLNKFARFYGVSSDWLLGLTNDPTTPEQRIESAISDDTELLEFWQELKEREDLQLLFKQVKPLPPDAIKRIIKYIKMVEDEEAMEDEY
jgi:transcriptional regulator with XRE-family HTH domain